ncbi:MAG: cytochrome C [Archangiaceae bacterium]|nr:cytochrome C [Archangiaceae bacterium]
MMPALLLLTFLSGAPDAPKRGAALVPAPSHAAGTRCSACHVTASWSDVRFNHDKTGFPLKGQHVRVDCRGCHAADFSVPVGRQCAACHLDVHAGDLGGRCEGCHDESSWASAFDADAHRRTAFPLLGAHGVMPCQECHSAARERRFSRAIVQCASCHQADLARTAGTGVDHTTFQFTQPCQTCHGALAFKPARFPGHDACFRISSGPHAEVACAQCHSALPATAPNSCATGTAACVSCHEHSCGERLQRQHPATNPAAAGFQCSNPKCAQCHQFD